jgi:2-keto-4-pentenoate hydratase/2-oxohepta-3-ene-1,7-dioic acid hydratase in catechol pathway
LQVNGAGLSRRSGSHVQRRHNGRVALVGCRPVRIARYSAGGDPAYGVVEDDSITQIDGHPIGAFTLTGTTHTLADVRLLAPILPTKIVGIGKNYADHAAEMGGDAPAEPLMFLKPSSAVIGPGDPIARPGSVGRVDYEGELAVVIGKVCRDVPPARAYDVVLGYACGNDVTARDQQLADGQWTRAKGYDTFCPLGPWIETELDPADLELTTTVNGEVKQSARTSQLINGIPTLIAQITAVMTLLPGDVVLTGTPAGVGPIEVGDEVSVTIGGIGSLTNVVRERA